jgi:hypothetical protein
MAEGKALGKNDLFESDAFNDAIKGADALLNIIRETNKEIKLSLASQKEFVSAFKPKSFDDVKKLNNELRQTSDLIKMKQQLEVAELKVQQQQESLNAAKIRSSIEQNRLTREQLKAENDLTKAIDAETKANQRAEQQLRQTNGEYKKGVQALAQVKQQLKELEFTGRTNGKLFKALSQEFTELDKRVRGAETSVGEFQRNVGNYKSGFDGLGNSINQLSREMPAFANSVQTGFMAISNNLPQLFDEINKIKKANVELAKSGQPTTSAFKQVLSGIFSWQTALSVGVTLLTLYGGKMIDFIGNLFSAGAAFKDGAEAIDSNTKAIERNKEALINLQNQVDATIVKELEMDGVLNDLDLARDAAYNAYEKNLDDIQKLRKQAADDQIKAAAQSISDEEDRVEFLAKLGREEVSGVVAITMKKGITRRDFSDEELKLLQSTNSKLLGLQSQYDRAEEKAAELLNEALVLGKKEFDKKAAEQEQKVREKRQKAVKDLYTDEARIIALTNKLKADAVEDEYQRSLNALEADNLNEIKAIKASKSRAETKHQALLALELDFYRKRAELQMKMIMELQAEQDKYQDEATAGIEKELTERLAKEAKIRHDAQLVRIYQNDKDAKKELKAKIAAIEEERDILLKNAHLTKDEVYIIKYEAQKKIDELEKSYSKKRIDNAINEANKLVSITDRWIKARFEKRKEYLDREIDLNKSAIEQQQKLAERGLKNTLAFEQSKAAKLQLERKRLQEQEIKQQKIVAFYNLFSGYAKTEPATALQKAILETTLAEIIAGSFIDGTENVERDLSGNKVHNGKDGYVIAVDGDERIFNPKQNAKIGDISNDEAAQILSDYQSGKLFNYGDVTQPIINVPNQHIDLRSTNNLLLEVKRAIENKPVNHTNLSNLGDVIETQITAGVKRVLIHKRQRRI